MLHRYELLVSIVIRCPLLGLVQVLAVFPVVLAHLEVLFLQLLRKRKGHLLARLGHHPRPFSTSVEVELYIVHIDVILLRVDARVVEELLLFETGFAVLFLRELGSHEELFHGLDLQELLLLFEHLFWGGLAVGKWLGRLRG
jgi:hypothetical protein